MRKLVVSAMAAVLVGMSAWGSAAVAVPPAAEDLPSSLHGAVETQAVTIGNGAAALLVDPGSAYAYSTLDRDDYGEGGESFTMTARGANLNLGTIPYAVLWAAPSCTPAEGDPVSTDGPCALSGGTVPGVTPNTGLHEAKGFPAYAEALYPPPPADSGQPAQDRVYKCVINKDGPGAQPTGGRNASICKTSDAIPLTAWAEAISEEYRATGFSRAAGFDTGLLKVAGSESFSQVAPIADGKLISEGYSIIKNISLLNGQITIDAVRSAARIVSAASGESKRDGVCTFTGLKIAGQNITSDGSELPYAEVGPMLKQISDATGYSVELIPPAPLVSKTVEGSQEFVSCAGFQIKITDTHTQAPVPVCAPVQVDPSVPQCIPALANREEFSFGRITVQQAVNNSASFALGSADEADPSGAGAGLDSSGSDAGLGDLSASGADTMDDLLGSSGAESLGNGSGSPTQSGSAAGAISTGGLENAAHRVNSANIGILTAVSALAWLVGILVLVGVINSLATGQRLRLPGF